MDDGLLGEVSSLLDEIRSSFEEICFALEVVSSSLEVVSASLWRILSFLEDVSSSTYHCSSGNPCGPVVDLSSDRPPYTLF